MASSERQLQISAVSKIVDAEQTRPGHEIVTTPNSSFDLKILIVATSLFLLLLSAFCFNLSLRWALRRLYAAAPSSASPSSPASPPSGLKKRQLSSIPSIHFSSLPQSEAATSCQCPICLLDFAAADQIRLLPICQHVFHVSCVDMWLVKNSSCPTCRGNIMEALSAEPASLQVQVQIVISHEGALSSSISKEETCIKYFL